MESLLTNETQESLGQNQKRNPNWRRFPVKKSVNTAIETCNKAPRVNGWLENMKKKSVYLKYMITH